MCEHSTEYHPSLFNSHKGSPWRQIVVAKVTLFLPQAIFLYPASAQESATEHAPLAQQCRELGPPAPRVSWRPGCLLMVLGRTAADVPIDYGTDGDLSQVAKAILEIKDDRGNLIFTTEVPVQREGQFVWPKGVALETTPDTLSFRVQNPGFHDSREIEVQPEDNTSDNPTQVLLSISPSRVVRGSKSVLLTLKGRNFRPNTDVSLKPEQGGETKLKAQFVSSTMLRARLPGRLFSKVQEWSVEVLEDGYNNSDALSLWVVPEGFPPAPSLESVTPAEIRTSENPQDKWLILRGRNFIKDNTKVFLNDSDLEELETKLISHREVKALLPSSYLSGPRKISIHVESASDPVPASQHLILEILTVEGHHAVPFDPYCPKPEECPELISVNDGCGYLVIPPPRSDPTDRSHSEGPQLHKRRRCLGLS